MYRLWLWCKEHWLKVLSGIGAVFGTALVYRLVRSICCSSTPKRVSVEPITKEQAKAARSRIDKTADESKRMAADEARLAKKRIRDRFGS